MLNSFLAEGANPNFLVSSRIQSGKVSTDSPQVRGKMQLKGLDSEKGSRRDVPG